MNLCAAVPVTSLMSVVADQILQLVTSVLFLAGTVCEISGTTAYLSRCYNAFFRPHTSQAADMHGSKCLLFADRFELRAWSWVSVMPVYTMQAGQRRQTPATRRLDAQVPWPEACDDVQRHPVHGRCHHLVCCRTHLHDHHWARVPGHCGRSSHKACSPCCCRQRLLQSTAPASSQHALVSPAAYRHALHVIARAVLLC